MPHPGDNPTPDERAELRRLLAEAPEADPIPAPVDMTRDEALVRLADQLGDDGFASVHLAEVAITKTVHHGTDRGAVRTRAPRGTDPIRWRPGRSAGASVRLTSSRTTWPPPAGTQGMTRPVANDGPRPGGAHSPPRTRADEQDIPSRINRSLR